MASIFNTTFVRNKRISWDESRRGGAISIANNFIPSNGIIKGANGRIHIEASTFKFNDGGIGGGNMCGGAIFIDANRSLVQYIHGSTFRSIPPVSNHDYA